MMTRLEEEIRSQPEVIARLLDRETGHAAKIVAHLPGFSYIVIAARGSSDYAATYATYAWASLAGYPVALATPSLYTLYKKPPRLDGALVVGISQSGQSPDIVTVLEEGRQQGRPTLAITNDGNSPLAQAADHVIELHAGAERSVAATKTYTAQLTAVALLATAWSGSPEQAAELERLPHALETTLAASSSIAQQAERYRYMDRCVVIGRGYNYATAFELALKLKELTYVMASPYSSADFQHGPIATVESGLPIFLVMPTGGSFADMLDIAHSLQALDAELLVISGSEQALSLAKTPMRLPVTIPEWLTPVSAILPGQLFVLHLALARGGNPDVPRGLQKVTRTL